MPTYHLLETRAPPRLLSIVIPVYNEEAALPHLRDALKTFFLPRDSKLEFLVVNDGSSDRSLDFLVRWANEDDRVKLISFSRNYGHQIAVTAGLDYARGDAVVVIDADLQDPLQVIPLMIERYEQGYDVAYGQRVSRSAETAFKRFTAWAFYRLMKKLVHRDLPVDAGDFRLMSRAFVDEFNRMREPHRFLRGMAAWAGFSQIAVPFERQPRSAGETKYPLSKMLRFAWTAAISFSSIPLRFSLALGLIVAFLGMMVGVYAVACFFIYHFARPEGFTYSPGWASIVTLICVIGGSILVGIGILGEYLGRVFETIKGRPLYSVRMTRNIPSARVEETKACNP